MKLKSIPLLLLMLSALMLVLGACGGGPSEADINATVEARVEQAKASLVAPTSVPTPTAMAATVAPISISTPYPTDTTAPTSPPWGLLTSLPVEASDVLAAGALLDKSINQSDENRTFTGFGMPRSGNSELVSPQWEFAVPPGAPALAPVTGYVVGIHTLWSDDLSVWLSADGGESRVWEVEHVVDVLVEVGDFVEAGQPIATASVFGGREIALVELGLFKGGQAPTHYCPLLYVDEDASSLITSELAEIRMENFDRLSSRGISIPVNDPAGQSCWTDLPIVDSP